jgi:energy-coupling factor transporter ATP-binding protein EcfA2
MSRRQRGVVLTDRGKERLEAAIASAQDQEKYGARFTQPELESRAGLSIKTIKKIRHQDGLADQLRVEGLFKAFSLTLETADYGWPQSDADGPLQPGFDVMAYRRCLQTNYGYLKLYTLDSTDRADNIKLWSMFIEQTVREALPPSRYELPLDLKRQLQDEDALGEDLSAEALDYYRREYFQQPARKVLAAVAESQRCVVLGDPGAGKSTLLQYLGLEWVENDAADLPLLIELREYALAESANFLEFLHRGRGVDWQVDPTVLHDYLTQYPTLVMFDGLDEVFDRATQAAIIDDIIRFAQQYPLAKILVTSRIIGYNPERLQHAEFHHFTIQPLDDGEVDEFIERWYDLAMGSGADKVRLKQRLREAIASSKAIQNLADNPLLLTMMAILNRRQELPRDRADLYDQASRVLLYHWDVDHKRLQLPIDAIGRREKQEILRLVAYEMQAGEDGLKGNLISANRLTQILTEYLREQGFSEPREKASGLIHQLRHRNFILCDRGADTYGFVHRTFLEYFCAVEIVNRFERQRTLSFEQLQDEVFGLHWQDETWHEVLRLICGMIDATFSGEIIQSLLMKEIDRSEFLIRESWGQKRLQVGGFMNLILASDCLSEVKNVRSIFKIQSQVGEALKHEIENYEHPLSWDSANALIKRISKPLDESLSWLKEQVESNKSSFIQCAAVGSIAASSKNEEILHWLKELAINGSDWGIRVGAVDAISDHPSCKSPEIFGLLRDLLKNDNDWGVRRASVKTLSKHFSDLPEAFNLLCQVAQNDPFSRNHAEQDNPRLFSLSALLENYPSHDKTHELLRDRALNDNDEQLREWASQQLEKIK